MYIRLFKYPRNRKKSFFLFGARGTGKTTWLKANFPEALFIDLLDFEYYQVLSARPNRLANLIPDGFKDWIILDEIQKIPGLLNEVHRLIESRGCKFVLTGSSARGLRKKGVNLLAGRALTYKMHPLTTIEMGKDFDIRSSLQWGRLPAVTSEHDPEAFLKSYVQTYMREEVLQEGLTKNLGDFSRFLETAAFSQASVINISDIARDCGIDRMRVNSYFSILEDLLLARRLPVFTKRAKRRMSRHPKFFYFDSGVFRSIRPMGFLDSPEDAEGAALETLFFQEICAINDYYNYKYDIYYWRTGNGIEVDFILYGADNLIAIEIKRSSRINKKDLKGLKTFKQDFPQSRLYLLYGGKREEFEDGVHIMPITNALKNLPAFLRQ